MTKAKASLSSSSSPPIHIHADMETPVHVHVKRGTKKSASAMAVEERMKASKNRFNSTLSSAGNLRPTRSAKGPWVPAPGKSTKGQKFSWNGSSARLEIQPPGKDSGIRSTLRMEDLDDEEDEVQHRLYEKKIDTLMTEVDSLKTEREIAKSKRAAERAKEQLDLSRRVLEEQEDELRDFKEELQMTERENRLLRKSMDQLKDDAHYTSLEKDLATSERDQLLKKLVETEMDARSAIEQVDELRDVVRRLREEKRLSSHDGKVLAKQRQLLLEKLQDFETTNSALRRMLREEHQRQSTMGQATEQRDILLKKLTESESANQALRLDALESSRAAESMRATLEAERNQARSLADLHTSVESTKAHLQNQLRKREADCNRMAVQIRNLENQVEQEKLEVDHLQSQLLAAKEKAAGDKDALKRATRAQKERASRSEDAVEKLQAQILEAETMLAESTAQVEELKGRGSKLTRDKTHLEGENSNLRRKIEELEERMRELDMTSRTNLDRTNADLHQKTAEAGNLRLENDRLQIAKKEVEDRLTHALSQVDQLKASVQQYESLVADYKSQLSHTELHVLHTMNRSRREALDVSMQLEQSQHTAARVKQETTQEIEKVRSRLEQRLLELEPLPGMLRTTEQKLLEATEKLLSHEQKSLDQTKLITELSTKVDHHGSQMELFRQKWMTAEDECRALQAKQDSLQRRLQEADDQNRELHTTLTKREEAVHQAQLRLEEKTRDSTSLTRQLEQSVADNRRLEDEAREKALARERTSQARILDLEAQLSRIKGEVVQTRRQKEDMERKFNSQVYDLKDRLEQSHSTNRSMQNYVSFLKNSYANVFGETSGVAGSPYRPRSSLNT
ncbi:outer dense fiber protein 2-like [Diadema antillarum]|uniref:outer dense fiber protein 2-like n=1 Tax=Diadema antillarum TaxID=105358 RepID=UPI003A857B0A